MASGTKDARKDIQKFNRRFAKIEPKIVAAYQRQGRKEQRQLAGRFGKERYAGANRAIRRLRRYGAAWRSRKRRLGYDLRRGHAGLGISKTLRSRSAFVRTKAGFILDFERPNLKTTVRLLTKRNRRIPVRTYLRFYARKKAPGLGTLSRQQMKNLGKAARNETRRQLRRITNAAGSHKVITLQLTINKLGVS